MKMFLGSLGIRQRRAVSAVVVVVAVGSSVTASCVPDFVFPDDSSVGGMGGGDGVPPCKNGRLDPGETDTDCGGVCVPCDVGFACVIPRDCQRPPMGDPSYADCVEGRCVLSCLGERADCDARAESGCEADLLTSLDHCGECGEKCSPKNAVGQCMNGRCLIKTDAINQGCDPNFADCNRDPIDGCEVNLLKDPEHCGACEDAVCSSENGTPLCSATPSTTVCGITCSAGYADCDADKNTNNGCETRTDRSINNCGACGNVCHTNGSGWSAFCATDQDGVIKCGQTECGDNLGDCDGDGDCSDALDTVTHCGGCGLTCSVGHGIPGCNAGTCAIESCDSGPDGEWEDCDGYVETGCEVNTLSSPSRCGGCDVSPDGDGEDCSAGVGKDHVALASCTQGACEVAGCEPPWLDCDGDFDNGCEVNSQMDDANCGACAEDGGEVCSPRTNTPGICASGSCDYSCNPGWADLNVDRYNEVSDGCEARDLVVRNAGAWGSQDTGGDTTPALTIQHTLQGAPGTQRLVLVGVVCRDTATSCHLTTATYGGTQLTLLREVFLVDSSAKIYFALDAALPAPGSYTVTLDKDNSWGSISAEVVELNGAEQDQFFAASQTATNDQSCDSSPDISADLLALPAGSIVYAVGGGNRSTGEADGGCTPDFPLQLSVSKDVDYIVFGSAYSDTVDGDVTASLAFSACDHSVMVTVGVRPEKDY